VGWQVGTAGLVLRWGGDGRWERMRVPTAAHLHAVAFSSPPVLLAAGALRSTLLRSVDAGRSWQVRCGAAQCALWRVACGALPSTR